MHQIDDWITYRHFIQNALLNINDIKMHTISYYSLSQRDINSVRVNINLQNIVSIALVHVSYETFGKIYDTLRWDSFVN